MDWQAGKLRGIRRLADRNGRFKMVAVDQRPPIKNLIKERRQVEEAGWDDVAGFKRMLVEELQAQATAMLLDPHFAYPGSFRVLDPRIGLIFTLEDSLFTETNQGRKSSAIDDWSVEKIKRAGGDAVKVLAWYRPDAGAEVNAFQQDFVKRIGDACARFDIPFVFELLVYPLAGDADQTQDYVEMGGKNPDHVLASVEEFAKPDYGVDIFKLESPVGADSVPDLGAEGSDRIQDYFNELGRLAGRPWVMLSAGAGMDAFTRILGHAYAAGASGYLAGRAIWLEAFDAFPNWDRIRAGLRDEAVPYMGQLNALTDQAALPWNDHPSVSRSGDLADANARFRHTYPDFGD